MEKNNFGKFPFRPELQEAIQQLQFKKPTEIQQKVIPAAIKGKSVIGQSHTGSGKTHTYLLPLFQRLDADKKEVQFVVTAPTRELARQIYDEVKKIIRYSGQDKQWTAKLLIGGTDRKKTAEKLKQPPHIIVGTPGRILDMVKDDAVSIYTASAFIIDEADLMLDLGFINEVDQLLVRSKEDIQLLVFSATIPQRLEYFFRKYLQNPLHVKIEDQLSPETMEHYFVALKHRNEADLILQIADIMQPYLAIIFANGKKAADQLHVALLERGLQAGLLHGGISPRERKRILKDIQNLRFQYIVATDLASRGIDIKGVSHVINARLPKEENFYIHRVGRTARAGMEGTAINLYNQDDLKLIEKLEQNGLPVRYADVKNGEWREAKPWDGRRPRKRTSEDIDKEAWKHVRKTTRVKPGYKKKMKKQQEIIKKQLRNKSKKKR